MGTTTAVDIINGGVKVNALPEIVTAMVNFRIDFSESVTSTQDHVIGILQKVAKRNEMKFAAFEDSDVNDNLGGRFVKVEVVGLPLEPAPRTPSSGGVWDLFAGTVKLVNTIRVMSFQRADDLYKSCATGTRRIGADSDSIRFYVSTLLALGIQLTMRKSGNTDCKMYYNLTKNVYRFTGAPNGSGLNTVSVFLWHLRLPLRL